MSRVATGTTLMPDLPDLTLPHEARGKLETPWDLKSLMYQGGAAAYLKEVNTLIDSGSLGKPLMQRLSLIQKLHETLKNDKEKGNSRATLRSSLKNLRSFIAWADATGHPVALEAIQQTYLEWTEHLLQRARVRKNLKQQTAYRYGAVVGALLDAALDRQLPMIQSSRLDRTKKNNTPTGVEVDKQNLEWTFRFGRMLQDICDNLALDMLWGPLPVHIQLRDGMMLEEWSKLTPAEKLLSTRRDTPKRRRNAIRSAANRALYVAERTLRTRYPLANLRIEAELLMFMGQTGMNLAQAHRLKLSHFSYSSYLDGYQIRDYKKRRGGDVLFEIFKEYKKHFERYLEWRRDIFPNEELLFPLVRFGRADDVSPEFRGMRRVCAKAGIPFVSPLKLRSTRVNWLLRRSRDPELTAEMDQHTKQTLLTVYERPSLQVAISEITRFWSNADPALTRTVAVAPGECDGEPEPVPGIPLNAAQPDCVQRTGCLWCAHYRDVDSPDYVWALACFHHLKIIELSRLRGPGDPTEGHPARYAIDRILEKMRWFHDFNELCRSWVEEATTLVEEGSYHPDWARLIEDMEGAQA